MLTFVHVFIRIWLLHMQSDLREIEFHFECFLCMNAKRVLFNERIMYNTKHRKCKFNWKRKAMRSNACQPRVKPCSKVFCANCVHAECFFLVFHIFSFPFSIYTKPLMVMKNEQIKCFYPSTQQPAKIAQSGWWVRCMGKFNELENYFRIDKIDFIDSHFRIRNIRGHKKCEGEREKSQHFYRIVGSIGWKGVKRYLSCHQSWCRHQHHHHH